MRRFRNLSPAVHAFTPPSGGGPGFQLDLVLTLLSTRLTTLDITPPSPSPPSRPSSPSPELMDSGPERRPSSPALSSLRFSRSTSPGSDDMSVSGPSPRRSIPPPSLPDGGYSFSCMIVVVVVVVRVVAVDVRYTSKAAFLPWKRSSGHQARFEFGARSNERTQQNPAQHSHTRRNVNSAAPGSQSDFAAFLVPGPRIHP